MAGELYVAKQAANFDYNGQPVFVNRGTIVRAGHPILRGHEECFEPLRVDYDVEQVEQPADEEPEKPAAPKGAVASSRADQQGARSR